MKKEFNARPSFLREREMYGFDWKEHVVALPSPLVVVTTYKECGKTNATMQSWLTFTNSDGFYCIFASVNKYGHMYSTIREKGELVINFPTAEIYMKCYSTINHNEDEDDEIEMSGLTAEKASLVQAPRIKECFLNLECEYVWEHEISPDCGHVVMCVRVVNVAMDEQYYNEEKKGRYGSTGYLYNIHAPINPETGQEEDTYVGVLRKYKTNEELEKEYLSEE